MSCTENESGPFVVFFLPAVVGCLTILLARRWANSQVSNTSSTAVSRRRKIIKDPLIKRPLPQITSKMMPPGSKKTSGVNKKGAFAVADEEINGSGKKIRSSRAAPTPSPNAVSEVKLTDVPVAPKHIPFPYIPQDGNLLFEAMTFVFTLVATGLQFLNLYRTAWWLPHSYTNQAMNFYLIDPHLVAFIVTIIFRKLLLSISLAILRGILAPKLMPHATIAARMFILGVVLGALSWCTYFIVLKYPVVKIFYLLYPAVIYFLLFGFQSAPFLELNTSDPPLHCCTHDAAQIRTEVEALRQDFNDRMKKIIFNSVVGAYYSSFIPCTFAQPYLYYEVYAASQQTAFVWAGLFARYVSQLVSATYCDVPHRSALHLGRWKPDHNSCTEGNEVQAWSAERMWSRGARVSCGGRVYVAATPTVAADPTTAAHTRFHTVFANPSLLLCAMLCLQLSLIILQLCLLFSSIQWHNFLAIVILLFINYYTLFKMVRDYLVAWKVYKAENMIQDKNGPLHSVPN
ncbi:transmembrane protein 39A [Spodoptera litura]|uniref:Transmembrane protein 39A n=1 Tax=Spodoptera litura TaxID=69820 RepID=A0A9J7EGC2_SPOLT|nr:transmembrane protein 39A [Spodoptera litura]